MDEIVRRIYVDMITYSYIDDNDRLASNMTSTCQYFVRSLERELYYRSKKNEFAGNADILL